MKPSKQSFIIISNIGLVLAVFYLTSKTRTVEKISQQNEKKMLSTGKDSISLKRKIKTSKTLRTTKSFHRIWVMDKFRWHERSMLGMHERNAQKNYTKMERIFDNDRKKPHTFQDASLQNAFRFCWYRKTWRAIHLDIENLFLWPNAKFFFSRDLCCHLFRTHIVLTTIWCFFPALNTFQSNKKAPFLESYKWMWNNEVILIESICFPRTGEKHIL